MVRSRNFSAGNDRSDEQLAPNFQAIWTPFRNRQQTRPVTAGGSPLFATPRRYLRRLSASPAFGKKAPLTNLCNQTSCQYGHPVKPPVSGTVLACASPTAVFGPCPATRTVCASFGATPSTSTPVNRFWRYTRPQMVPRIGGAACTSCDHSILLPRYGAAPALSEPGVTRAGRCLPVREP